MLTRSALGLYLRLTPVPLIVSEDKRPARWVHKLVSMTLHQALDNGERENSVRRLLIPAGGALRGHQEQAWTRFRGSRGLLRGSAEGLQDDDDRGISG